jgi:hypothetical protein
MVLSGVISGSALASHLNWRLVLGYKWRAVNERSGARVLDLLDVSHVTTTVATFDLGGLQNWCGR